MVKATNERLVAAFVDIASASENLNKSIHEFKKYPHNLRFEAALDQSFLELQIAIVRCFRAVLIE